MPKNLKRKIRRKHWLEARSRKIQKKMSKKRGSHGNSHGSKVPKDTITAKAPEIFSFIQNAEDTISYFDEIIIKVKEKLKNRLFFIDSSDVQIVTADALMYLIAVLYNLKEQRDRGHLFKGNWPKAEDARLFYEECGFLKYVNSKRLILPPSSDNIQIVSGKGADPVQAKSICDFAQRIYNVDKKSTIKLYKTLIELMTNTAQHAYNKSDMVPCWYLFAKLYKGLVQITFLDTGAGIPATVKKKWLENLTTSDADLILSAFKGEFRTETNMEHRGLGLPLLYEYIMNMELMDFYIISGKGGFVSNIDGDGSVSIKSIIFKEREREVIGTVYQFSVNYQEKNNGE